MNKKIILLTLVSGLSFIAILVARSYQLTYEEKQSSLVAIQGQVILTGSLNLQNRIAALKRSLDAIIKSQTTSLSDHIDGVYAVFSSQGDTLDESLISSSWLEYKGKPNQEKLGKELFAKANKTLNREKAGLRVSNLLLEDDQRYILLGWYQQDQKLIAVVKPDAFQKYLEGFQSTRAQLQLVTGSGKILAHQKAEYLGAQADNDKIFRRIVKGHADEPNASFVFNEEEVVSFERLPDSNLLLISRSDFTQTLADIRSEVMQSGLIGLGILMISLALISGVMQTNRHTQREGRIPSQNLAVSQFLEPETPEDDVSQVLASLPKVSGSQTGASTGPTAGSSADAPSGPNAGAAPRTNSKVESFQKAPPTVSAKELVKDSLESIVTQIKGPLLSILGYAQIIANAKPAEALGSALDKAGKSNREIDGLIREARKIKTLVEKTSSFLGVDQSEDKVTTTLDVPIARTVKELSPLLESENVVVHMQLNTKNSMTLAMTSVCRALTQLLQNSIDAMARVLRKEITIKAYDQGERVILEILDSGEGILPDVIGKVTEPFFTTRLGRQKMGMGLSVAQEIFASHGGSLTIESEAGFGTKVKVEFLDEASKQLAPSDSKSRFANKRDLLSVVLPPLPNKEREKEEEKQDEVVLEGIQSQQRILDMDIDSILNLNMDSDSDSDSELGADSESESELESESVTGTSEPNKSPQAMDTGAKAGRGLETHAKSETDEFERIQFGSTRHLSIIESGTKPTEKDRYSFEKLLQMKKKSRTSELISDYSLGREGEKRPE